MIDLDDNAALEKLDSQDVLGTAERFAEQCREGWALGRAVRGLPDGAGVEHVVVLGMGGSGISGDVVQALVEPRLPVPFRTVKSYGPLPEWIGRNTLVFAVSYSGNTEETLAAFQEAHERGARAVTVSAGGRLAELAEAFGVAHVQIPSGLQPRASLGFLTLPILGALVEIGLVPDFGDDVEESVEVLTEIGAACHRKRGVRDNPAKQLASKIVGRVPVVYGADGLSAAAAYRFKCDLNEYAKSLAFHNVLPELDHNEIVGWSGPKNSPVDLFVVVLIRDVGEHPRVAVRFDVTRALVERRVNEVVEMSSEGQSALARMLSLVMLSQFVSIYVGLAYGVDPGPVDVVERLKRELSRR